MLCHVGRLWEVRWASKNNFYDKFDTSNKRESVKRGRESSIISGYDVEFRHKNFSITNKIILKQEKIIKKLLKSQKIRWKVLFEICLYKTPRRVVSYNIWKKRNWKTYIVH